MEINGAYTAAACSIIIVLWALRVMNLVFFTPKKLEKHLKQQGLNGNPFRILHADTKQSSKMPKDELSSHDDDDIVPSVLPLLHQTIKTYGKASLIWFGWTPRVLIMEAELVREVFVKCNVFEKIEPNPLVKLFVNGLASYNGDTWAKHKKLIAPAFHIQKLKHMVPSFLLSCSEMIRQWEKMTSTNINGSCEIDVSPYLEALTSDGISRTAFGSSYQHAKKIFHLQKELGKLANQALQSVYIPGWRYLPTMMNRRMKQISKEMKALVKKIIDEKMDAMKLGENSGGDLLSILIESNLSDKEKLSMSIEEVIQECKQFYFVGQETMSVMLAWAMYLLSIHPNWQERARKEVSQVFGNEIPKFEGINQLEIVQMILYEVLRLYPPVVIRFRNIHKEIKLGNLWLKPGIQVALPILLLHRDKEIWGDDANKFNPERFRERQARSRMAFFPYGWGPRVCIGQNFAMLEAKVSMAIILQRFSFELSSSHVHAPRVVLTLQPQHGVRLIMRNLKVQKLN